MLFNAVNENDPPGSQFCALQAQKTSMIAAFREKVWPIWDTGRLRPFTFRRFSLRERLRRLMESSVHIGKIRPVP